ncbi:MAG: hypothetical protein ACMUHX_07290 [bacterium]
MDYKTPYGNGVGSKHGTIDKKCLISAQEVKKIVQKDQQPELIKYPVLAKVNLNIYDSECSLLTEQLLRDKKEFNLDKRIKKLSKYGAVILDDIGYVQEDRGKIIISIIQCPGCKIQYSYFLNMNSI